MSQVTKIQILKLYKDLLRYGQNLKFTDKDYFHKRIRREFRKNRDLTDESAISFNFERGIVLLVRRAVQ
ncbi:mitochondrial ribosome and complex I assembly factor AltMIEF1 [Tribolium castaneum]|uniref:mitochondrial ribosome and complex I assembly factor AltMIEF1 n=1 Tax=Tribolium castaneum TaxID=7070 RepID=UPI0030FE6B46